MPNRYSYALLIIITVLGLTINVYRFVNKEGPRIPKMHACLRTRDGLNYIDELISFHKKQGITSFNIYDDSNKDNSLFFRGYPSVTYKHVGGVKVPNENYFIWECMVETIIEGDHDYVLNMDDDEFIFPSVTYKTILQLISEYEKNWFDNAWCIAMPVFFFGTKRSSHTGLTTKDFVHRDRDVSHNRTYPNDPSFFRYTKNNRIKRRIEKAIFKIPKNPTKLLTLLGNGMRNGALIHGYTLGCLKQSKLNVAHYTRDEHELKKRIETFWNNVNGLTKRFNTNKKIKAYLNERNRTEFMDERLRSLF